MTVAETAHRDAVRQDIGKVAENLQEVLGQRLTAYAANVRDPKAIGKYAQGREPRNDTEAALRNLYQVVRILLATETAATARAWMIGANPQLGDEAPVEVLHNGQLEPVIRAAEAFVSGG